MEIYWKDFVGTRAYWDVQRALAPYELKLVVKFDSQKRATDVHVCRVLNTIADDYRKSVGEPTPYDEGLTRNA